jgi:hypothetical protein
MKLLLLTSLASVHLAAALSISLDPSNSPYTFSLGDSKYYVPASAQNAPVAKYQINATSTEYWTLTALAVSNSTVGASTLEAAWKEYAQDDVWTDSFVEVVQIYCGASSESVACLSWRDLMNSAGCTMTEDALAYLEKCSTKMLLLSGNFKSAKSSSLEIIQVDAKSLKGPYLASTYDGSLSIFQVYGLAVDDWQGFTVGTIESDSGSHNYVSLYDGPRNSPLIPYPSKLYYSKTEEKPLAGLRFAVKASFLISMTAL